MTSENPRTSVVVKLLKWGSANCTGEVAKRSVSSHTFCLSRWLDDGDFLGTGPECVDPMQRRRTQAVARRICDLVRFSKPGMKMAGKVSFLDSRFG